MLNAESPPKLEFIFAAHVTVAPPLDLGDVGKGAAVSFRLRVGISPGRKLKSYQVL